MKLRTTNLFHRITITVALLIVTTTIGLLVTSFTAPQLERSEYFHWMNDAANGLVKEKTVNGITMSVKYLPVDYLVYKELDQPELATESQTKKLKEELKGSWNFVLTLSPESGQKDLMFGNVKDMNEYKQLTQIMNFNMNEFITLKIGKNDYKPVLSNMESTYGLGDGSRKIVFAFVPESGENFDEVTFTYNDELFGLGLNHFRFNCEDLENLPTIKF